MLKKLVLPAMLAAFFFYPAFAQSPGTASSYQLKDNAGATFLVKDFICGSTSPLTVCPASVPIDIFGNSLAGGIGTSNTNGTALYMQGVTGGVPIPITGSISNTSFGISGTLPAFAVTPTVNLGTIGGAATQTTSAAILSALGTPFQAGGSIANTSFGISGTLPAFAAPPTVNIGTAPTIAVTGTFFQATQPVSLASLPAFSSPPTVLSFASIARASITRSANTTTYTANTGWNNGTPTFFSFTGACRANGTQVLIPRIDIWSSANPATKLAGLLWLFAGIPGINISDNAAFTIASADFANLTGSFGGIPFTLGNNQAAGATNSGTSLTGLTYQGQCAAGSTTITGMVEVTNAYVPASGEVLNVGLATVGVN